MGLGSWWTFIIMTEQPNACQKKSGAARAGVSAAPVTALIRGLLMIGCTLVDLTYPEVSEEALSP